MPNDRDFVVPADFSELSQLVWNRDSKTPISGADALELYERNWRHVDRARLTEVEADLIRELVLAHGNGVMLVDCTGFYYEGKVK